MDFNALMTWLMPVIIVLFFVGILYVKMKGPADTFFAWIGKGIRNLLSKGKETATESVVMGSDIVFE